MAQNPMPPSMDPIGQRSPPQPEPPAGASALADQQQPAPDVAVPPEGKHNARMTMSPPDSSPRGAQSILTKEETAEAVEAAAAYGEGWSSGFASPSLVIEKSSPVTDQEAKTLEAITMEVHEGAIPMGSVGQRARQAEEQGESTLEVPLNSQAVREIQSLTERANEGQIPMSSFASEVKSVADRQQHEKFCKGTEVARSHAAGGVAPVEYRSSSEVAPVGGDITYVKAGGSLGESEVISGEATVDVPVRKEVAADLQSMTAKRNEGVVPGESLAAKVQSEVDKHSRGEPGPDVVTVKLQEVSTGE